MILAGTGHRPDKLMLAGRNAYDPWVYGCLVELAIAALQMEQDQTPVTAVISGMALGWDMALAEATLRLDLPLWAYVPFAGQEGAWSREYRERHALILAQASRREFVSGGGFAAWKMMARNKRMVDDCGKVLALWNGSPGGTANCVEYAAQVNRPLWNLWSAWEAAEQPL